MRTAMRFLTRPLTSPRLDAQTGQIICWVVAILVLVLGIVTLVKLDPSAMELFFGLLLVLAVSKLCVLIGLVLPLVADHQERNRS